MQQFTSRGLGLSSRPWAIGVIRLFGDVLSRTLCNSADRCEASARYRRTWMISEVCRTDCRICRWHVEHDIVLRSTKSLIFLSYLKITERVGTCNCTDLSALLARFALHCHALPCAVTRAAASTQIKSSSLLILTYSLNSVFAVKFGRY